MQEISKEYEQILKMLKTMSDEDVLRVWLAASDYVVDVLNEGQSNAESDFALYRASSKVLRRIQEVWESTYIPALADSLDTFLKGTEDYPIQSEWRSAGIEAVLLSLLKKSPL